jgi:hypothetical protein
MERNMSFDPCLLKALLPEFNQLAAKFPDEFVAFVKFDNATGADWDRFTPVYWDLADRALRPTTWLVRKCTVTPPDGKIREWTAQPPSRWLQFAAGQEQEFLLWENEHTWSKFQELAARAWNCLPESMHIPKPLCHFEDSPQLMIRYDAEYWPNFVAQQLRDSGKFMVVEKFPHHSTEVVYLKVGFFYASLLAIEKLLDTKGEPTSLNCQQRRKTGKKAGGRQRLEEKNPLAFQVYERIRKEHQPREQYTQTLDRLKVDRDFLEQVQDAGLGRLDTRLVRRALACLDQRKYDTRKKQQTPSI